MIKLGVVGFGNRISSMINYPMREVEPDLRVVGVVDPDEAAARGRLAECDRDAIFYHSLDEMVARDVDEYVELAVSSVGDLSRLAVLRAGLRQRMAASPLCDGPRFAANLLAALRDVWRHWCRT